MASTASQSLLGFLKEQKATESSSNQGPALREWQNDLHKLVKEIESWLRPADKADLVRIEEKTIEIEEPALGRYHATSLLIDAPRGRVIRIEPVALHVVGSSGRVDVRCGPKFVMLVRTAPGEWAIANEAPNAIGYSVTTLSEESFAELIRAILS